MGIIYILTSSSGKQYIGQTIRSLDKRWYEHVRNSHEENYGCRAIGSAIKKYGPDKFQREIIWDCPNDELNTWEEFFIDLYGTMYPNGYNLTKGGKAISKHFSNNMRDKISQGQRKNIDDIHDLPRYMWLMHNNGYMISIPGLPSAHFNCSEFSKDENYEYAVNCLENKDKITEIKSEYKRIKGERRREKIIKEIYIDGVLYELPANFIYYEKKSKFIVRLKNYPTKEFGNKKLTTQENYNRAMLYYNNCKWMQFND